MADGGSQRRQFLAGSNVPVNSSVGGQRRQLTEAVDRGNLRRGATPGSTAALAVNRDSQRRQSTEVIFGGEQRHSQQQHQGLTEADDGGNL